MLLFGHLPSSDVDTCASKDGSFVQMQATLKAVSKDSELG